jgi:hypothetical protein
MDVFAMGITLLVITFDFKIISNASEEDLLYRHIISRDYDTFWKEVKDSLNAYYQNDYFYE